MSETNRTLFEVHFHSHGDVQLGPRWLGGEREEEQPTPETGGGLSAGLLALAVLGVAVGAALLRRRRQATRRERPARAEQKNLDRWIPTR